MGSARTQSRIACFRQREQAYPANSMHGAAMTSPLAAYHQRLAAGELEADPAQEHAAQKLDELAQQLARWQPDAWLNRRAAPRGLYLWGPVGRGKSMLLDLFFEAAPVKKKRRTHFHEFMLARHAHLRELRAKGVGAE